MGYARSLDTGIGRLTIERLHTIWSTFSLSLDSSSSAVVTTQRLPTCCISLESWWVSRLP